MRKNSFTHKLITLGTAIVTIAGLTAYRDAIAASTASDTSGQATATVITSIAISRTAHLRFGSIAPGDGANTIAPCSDASSGPAAGTYGRGAYTVTGASGQTFTAAVVSTTGGSSVTMTTDDNSSADERITVNAFHWCISGGTEDTAGALTGGSISLYVGGTRAAATSSQVAGAYSSTSNSGADLKVTVSYQ